MFKLVPMFTVQVNYKSGRSQRTAIPFAGGVFRSEQAGRDGRGRDREALCGRL